MPHPRESASSIPAAVWMDGWVGGGWIPPDLSRSPPAPEVSQSPKAADVTLPATRVSWQCCGTLEMIFFDFYGDFYDVLLRLVMIYGELCWFMVMY